MYRNGSNRVIPIILVVVIAAALIFGLFTVGRYLFGNGGQKSTQMTQQKQASDRLTTIDADRSVRMRIRGPIVADENFRTYEISVSPSARIYTVYKGYLDSIDSTKTYDNNTQAYTQFVFALDKAAFTHVGKEAESLDSDLRGICASGSVYEYTILDGSGAIDMYWTSTCKGSPGSFGASVPQVTNLFAAQIPERVGFSTRSSSLRF